MRSDPLHRGRRNRQPVTCPLPTDSTETPRPDRRTPPTMRTFKDTDLFEIGRFPICPVWADGGVKWQRVTCPIEEPS